MDITNAKLYTLSSVILYTVIGFLPDSLSIKLEVISISFVLLYNKPKYRIGI